MRQKTNEEKLLDLVEEWKKRIVDDHRAVGDKYVPFKDPQVIKAFDQFSKALSASVLPWGKEEAVGAEFKALFGKGVRNVTANTDKAEEAFIKANKMYMDASDLDQLENVRVQMALDCEDLLFAAGLRSRPNSNKRPLRQLPRRPLL